MKSGQVKRWGAVERVNHWLLFLGVLLATLTGLPLFMPEVFGFLNPLFGSRAASIALIGPHLGGAILLILAAVLHIVHRLVKRRTEMLPSDKDVSDFMGIARHWFDSSKKYPALGFHHPGEKAVYWGAAVVGLAVLGVSGIVLWFPGMFPGFQSLGLLFHDLGFALLGVLVVGHFLMGVTRRNWPILKAMFTTGNVPLGWAKPRHPLWKEVQK